MQGGQKDNKYEVRQFGGDEETPERVLELSLEKSAHATSLSFHALGIHTTA